MKRILTLAVIGILILHHLPVLAALNPSGEGFSTSFYEWRFEINSAGTVHVELEVHLIDIDISLSSWELSFESKWEEKITDIKAYESMTHEEIEIQTKIGRETIQYFFMFDKKSAGENVDFTVEFTIEDALIRIVEDIDYFEWAWSTWENFMRHSIDITLPSGSEALIVSNAVPAEFTEKKGTIIHFEEKSIDISKRLRLGVAFSGVGKSYLEKAEYAFNSSTFEEALSNYESAAAFYESLGVFYGKTKDQFLNQLAEDFDVSLTPTYLRFSSKSEYDQFMRQLREKKILCEEKITEAKETEADALYSEAQRLFDGGDYETAQETFKKAQNMYTMIGDDEKARECQDYIDQCASLLEEEKLRKEAEEIFNKGVMYFEQQQYDIAKTTFQLALLAFTELGDEEKIEECNKWIASCEEALAPPEEGSCLGTAVVTLMVVAGVLIFRRRT